jgi:putative ABC transport system substrate-binding protein
MRRREFITLLGGAAAAWPVVARAEQGGPVKRVGFLTLASLKDQEGVLAAFLDGLRSHGLMEGKNLRVDYRYSEGDVKRLTPLAQELIALRPDVLVGAEPSPAKVLKSIAPALPIVCPQLTDAQLSDLVASYARPGGTVTGLAQTVEGLTGKLIELVQEIVPSAVRVGFLANPTGASMQFFAHSVEETARGRGILLFTEEAATPNDLSPALGRLARQQPQSERGRSDRAAGDSRAVADNLQRALWAQGGGISELRYRSQRQLSTCCRLRGQNPERRQACGHAN